MLDLLPEEVLRQIAAYLSYVDYKNLWYVMPSVRSETRHAFAERLNDYFSTIENLAMSTQNRLTAE
jgi:hypothetical protein